jgi:membrane protein YqaA with SNARE-associated domain
MAATVLPFSSEAVLFGVIRAGIPKWQAVFWASAGNCLACMLNYYLGRWLREKMNVRLQRSKAGRKASSLMERYGAYSLLLSWLPVIGDPITILAGSARISLLIFIPLVFALRIGRYILVAYGAVGGISSLL